MSPERAHYEGPRESLLGPAREEYSQRELFREDNVTRTKKIGAPGERPSGPEQRIPQRPFQTEPSRADSSCPTLQLAVTKGSAS